MTIEERMEALENLGDFLGQFRRSGIVKQQEIPFNDPYLERLEHAIEQAVHHNGWFTRDNVLFSLEQWGEALTRENLEHWLSRYTFEGVSPRKIGLVMAGNIPLVGLHDLLCVLICGHAAIIRQSSNDRVLMPVIVEYLQALVPNWKDRMTLLEQTSGGGDRMSGYDAIVATGSNNTSRYFEYYFRNVPSIIRKNRHSVAVLTGEESPEELRALGEDIFRYFGLGCRNVSKLYLPEGFDFDRFFNAIYPWKHLIDHAKYANNYDYNKAVYLMSQFELLENGFLILKKDPGLGSPIATLYYETYSSLSQVRQEILRQEDSIQCIVSKGVFAQEVLFGKTQQPQLWDYADGVDTISFLTEKI